MKTSRERVVLDLLAPTPAMMRSSSSPSKVYFAECYSIPIGVVWNPIIVKRVQYRQFYNIQSST